MADRPRSSSDSADAGALLAGRVALVTGASSGIGRAIALALAAAGADVAVSYRASEERARTVAGEIKRLGRRSLAIQLDLAEHASIAAIPAVLREAFGRVDIWINNAGADILTGAGAALPTLAKLDLLLAVDLRGTMLASWEAATMMAAQPDGGVIINVSWDHVVCGMPGRNPQMFSAVKGGVSSFSRSLARSIAPHVRVNILAPGWIETVFGENVDAEYHRQVAESTPLGRWGTPEDVARAAVFLASNDASFLTGQTIMVNGGVVM